MLVGTDSEIRPSAIGAFSAVRFTRHVVGAEHRLSMTGLPANVHGLVAGGAVNVGVLE